MVFETVRRARRRILANEAIRHGIYVSAAGLAVLIVLLLLGTDILGWGWLLPLPAVALAVGIYITWRRAPSLYQAAQRMDRSLHLADSLSTALFFSSETRGSADMRRAQWVQAQQIAAAADPRQAIPLRVPRAMYGAAGLALVAASLFGVRYGLSRSLDLRSPLARVIEERLGYAATRQAARDARQPRPPAQKLAQHGVSLDEAQQKNAGELDAAPDSALDSPGVPDADNKTGSSRAGDAKIDQSAQLESGENPSEQPEGISANPGDQQSADGKKGPGTGKPGPGDDKQTGSAGETSGLLGKFKDAMSSLLNHMREQPGAKGGQQQAGAQDGDPKGRQGNAAQNGKQGRQPGDAQQADAKDGQPGDDSQNAQSSQPGSPGESGQQPATKQPGSGIGRQDGSKDVKLAEQLAAMGKISEIIGKRAANVSGEVTVEVQNSNQQLRTPYAQRAAHHAEAGGEINRDEVPEALQAYVEQYFEQVRKQAPGAPRARHKSEPTKPEPPKPGL